MEAIGSSEILIFYSQTTRRHIPEVSILPKRCVFHLFRKNPDDGQSPKTQYLCEYSSCSPLGNLKFESLSASLEQKFSLYSMKHQVMTTYFLTSILDVGDWLASRPDCFTPGERPLDTRWTGGWLGSRDCLD
jgi:hypothetical protein